jgi:tRNA(Arg) A34 adenosine deaminase TadA
MDNAEHFLLQAIDLARENIGRGGRPFGAVVVKNGELIATGVNEVDATNDPTAHAELLAVRAAGQALGSPSLAGCAVYASGHPCPMCLAAMRVAGVAEVFYAYSNDDGADYGFTSAAVYADLAKPFAEQSMSIAYVPVRPEGRPELYAEWQEHVARQA